MCIQQAVGNNNVLSCECGFLHVAGVSGLILFTDYITTKINAVYTMHEC